MARLNLMVQQPYGYMFRMALKGGIFEPTPKHLKVLKEIAGLKKLSTVEIYLRASGMESEKLAKKLGFFD